MKLTNNPKSTCKSAPKTRYGHCSECGKKIALRNSDGMIRKHGHPKRSGDAGCVGSFMTPSKAAASEYKADWAPPRRSN